jgi:hypothetical protein
MNNEEKYSPDEEREAEQLNSAIDAMRAGKSPAYFSVQPEFRKALDLHTHTTADAELDQATSKRIEADVVKRFGTGAAATKPRWKTFALFGVPAASFAVLVVGVLAAVKPELFGGTARNTAQIAEQSQDDTTSVASGSANTNESATTTNQNANAENTNTYGTANTNSNTPAETETNEGTNADETVQELFPEIDTELVSVEPELGDLTDIKNEIEEAMDELEDILEDIETLETMDTDADAVDDQLNELSSISI